MIEPGAPAIHSWRYAPRGTGCPRLHARVPCPPPERLGLSSHRRAASDAVGALARVIGTATPPAASVRATASGLRTRARTSGGFPSRRRPRESSATAPGWFSKLEVYATSSALTREAARAAVWGPYGRAPS